MNFAKIACLTALLLVRLLVTPSASADSIQVTFTGDIEFTFDEAFGGPSFHGIKIGDSFSAVLTYNLAQPNLGTVANQGLFGEYDFRVTVQTENGPVTLGQPVSWPCPGCAFSPLHVFNDAPVTLPYVGPVTVDAVHNSGSDVTFSFLDLTHTALASDSLADVDWQNLFTLSKDSTQNLEATYQPKIALRAPNAAIVVEGRIDSVSVQAIVPEPSSILLLGVGLLGLLLYRPRV